MLSNAIQIERYAMSLIEVNEERKVLEARKTATNTMGRLDGHVGV